MSNKAIKHHENQLLSESENVVFVQVSKEVEGIEMKKLSMTYNPKISNGKIELTKNIEYDNTIQFISLLQKDQTKELKSLSNSIWQNSKENIFIDPEMLTLHSKESSDPVEIVWKTLKKTNFFGQTLIEYMVKNNSDSSYADLILPLIDYCYFELPKEFYDILLNKPHFCFKEKLKWVECLLVHSKKTHFHCQTVSAARSYCIKNKLRKKLISLQMNHLISQNNKKLQIKEATQEIINFCVDKGFLKIAMLFSKILKRNFFSDNFLCFLLKENKFRFFNKLYKKIDLHGFLLTEPCWNLAIEFLDSKKNFLQGIFLVFEMKKYKKLRRNQHLKFIKIMEKIINLEKNEEILSCLNPILVLVMLSILNLKMSKLNTPFLKIYIKNALMFKNCAFEIFQEIVSNLEECRLYLYKICFPSKYQMINLLFKQKEFFIEILSQDIVLKTIENSLLPEYIYDYNFLAASTSLAIINKSFLNFESLEKECEAKEVSPFKKDDDLTKKEKKERFSTSLISQLTFSDVGLEKEKFVEIGNIFKFLKTDACKTLYKNNHIYQYPIFIRSFFFQSFVQILVYIFSFVYILATFDDYNLITAGYSDFISFFQAISKPNELPAKYFSRNATIYSNITDFMNEYNPKNEMGRTFCLFYIYDVFNKYEGFEYSLFLNDYSEKCLKYYVALQNYIEKETKFTSAGFLSLFLGLSFIFNLVFQWKVNRKIMWSKILISDIIITLLSILFTFLLMNFNNLPMDFVENSILLMRISCSAILFLFWIRFLAYFELFKDFAVKIQIIKNMIWDLMAFFNILIFVLFCFATVTFSFFKNSVYNNLGFTESVFILIGSAFGNFGLSLEDVYFTSYSILLIFFMFFVVIILFNLLIAILSNTYSKMIERANTEYGHILYTNSQTRKYNINYSALTIFPPLFNIPLFLFIFSFLRDNNQTCNQTVMKLGYFFILLVWIGVFITCNLVLIPLCWIQILVKIIVQRYRFNKNETKIGLKLVSIHFLTWVLFGNLYLCVIFILKDLPLFLKSSYMLIEKKSENILYEKFFFIALRDFIKGLEKKNIENIELERFSNELKETIDINGDNYRLRLIFEYNKFIDFSRSDKEEIENYLIKLSSSNNIVSIPHLNKILENLDFTQDLIKKRKNPISLMNLFDLNSISKLIIFKNK